MSFVGGAIQTVWVRRFTGMISSFLLRQYESELEPESACTTRVFYGVKRNDYEGDYDYDYDDVNNNCNNKNNIHLRYAAVSINRPRGLVT